MSGASWGRDVIPARVRADALPSKHTCTCGRPAARAGACAECQRRARGRSIQTKLRVGDAGGRYEQEADRAADQVLGMAEPRSRQGSPSLSAAPLALSPVGGGSGTLDRAPSIVEEVLAAPGQPLDAASRAFFEPRFNRDFSAVRLHADDVAGASARAVRATAYAAGSHVVVDPDHYAPGTQEGKRLLAHELAHVAQQEHLQHGSHPPIQRSPSDAPAGCVQPDMPAGTIEWRSPSRHVLEMRGDDAWVIRLQNFAIDDASPRSEHVAGLAAALKEANLRTSTDPTYHSWEVSAIVGHASPEGGEQYNQALALQRAQNVAGQIAGASAAVSSGEACAAGAAREDYSFYRAVDVTLTFMRQSFPAQVEVPQIESKGGKIGKVDPNKLAKGGAVGLKEGLKDALEGALSEHDPKKGPPKLEIDLRKAAKGLAEGGAEGGVDIAWGVMVERSHELWSQRLVPEIQAQIDRLAPQAEQMLAEDPNRPVYAVVHTVASHYESYEYESGSSRKPTSTGVALAEPVTLSREPVSKSYTTRKKNMAARVDVIEKHEITSVKLTSE